MSDGSRPWELKMLKSRSLEKLFFFQPTGMAQMCGLPVLPNIPTMPYVESSDQLLVGLTVIIRPVDRSCL